ncbi:MAG: hypothetical protein ACO1OB_05625 [Archangium sp.]
MRRTIRFRAPSFYSELDEELFFIGLRLVASVRKYVGRGSELVVTLSDDDDTELDALLRRFKVKRVD